MQAFYKISVVKQAIGSAVMHKEPPLQGAVIIKITDTGSDGDYKIVALECSEEQHIENLSYPGVASMEEDEAVKLAPKYQPKRTFSDIDPRTRKEQKIERPAADLKSLLKIRKGGVVEAGVEMEGTPPKKRVSRKKASSKPS